MNPFARVLTGLVVALLALAACGGGGGSGGSSNSGSSSSGSSGSGSSSNSDTGPGQAAVSIVWPSRDRSVPLAANSAVVAILRSGKTLQSGLVVRPADGSASTVSFKNLPLGSLAVQLSTYLSSDGTGSALSVGSSTLTSAEGTPTPVSVGTDPVVASLSFSASTLNVSQNATATLGLTASDAAGGTVAISANAVTWTSDNPSIATITGNESTATVSGLAVGSTTVHATFTRADGTTTSVSATVTVTATGGSVTVT